MSHTYRQILFSDHTDTFIGLTETERLDELFTVEETDISELSHVQLVSEHQVQQFTSRPVNVDEQADKSLELIQELPVSETTDSRKDHVCMYPVSEIYEISFSDKTQIGELDFKDTNFGSGEGYVETEEYIAMGKEEVEEKTEASEYLKSKPRKRKRVTFAASVIDNERVDTDSSSEDYSSDTSYDTSDDEYEGFYVVAPMVEEKEGKTTESDIRFKDVLTTDLDEDVDEQDDVQLVYKSQVQETDMFNITDPKTPDLLHEDDRYFVDPDVKFIERPSYTDVDEGEDHRPGGDNIDPESDKIHAENREASTDCLSNYNIQSDNSHKLNQSADKPSSVSHSEFEKTEKAVNIEPDNKESEHTLEEKLETCDFPLKRSQNDYTLETHSSNSQDSTSETSDEERRLSEACMKSVSPRQGDRKKKNKPRLKGEPNIKEYKRASETMIDPFNSEVSSFETCDDEEKTVQDVIVKSENDRTDRPDDNENKLTETESDLKERGYEKPEENEVDLSTLQVPDKGMLDSDQTALDDFTKSASDERKSQKRNENKDALMKNDYNEAKYMHEKETKVDSSDSENSVIESPENVLKDLVTDAQSTNEGKEMDHSDENSFEQTNDHLIVVKEFSPDVHTVPTRRERKSQISDGEMFALTEVENNKAENIHQEETNIDLSDSEISSSKSSKSALNDSAIVAQPTSEAEEMRITDENSLEQNDNQYIGEKEFPPNEMKEETNIDLSGSENSSSESSESVPKMSDTDAQPVNETTKSHVSDETSLEQSDNQPIGKTVFSLQANVTYKESNIDEPPSLLCSDEKRTQYNAGFGEELMETDTSLVSSKAIQKTAPYDTKEIDQQMLDNISTLIENSNNDPKAEFFISFKSGENKSFVKPIETDLDSEIVFQDNVMLDSTDSEIIFSHVSSESASNINDLDSENVDVHIYPGSKTDRTESFIIIEKAEALTKSKSGDFFHSTDNGNETDILDSDKKEMSDLSQPDDDGAKDIIERFTIKQSRTDLTGLPDVIVESSTAVSEEDTKDKTQVYEYSDLSGSEFVTDLIAKPVLADITETLVETDLDVMPDDSKDKSEVFKHSDTSGIVCVTDLDEEHEVKDDISKNVTETDLDTIMDAKLIVEPIPISQSTLPARLIDTHYSNTSNYTNKDQIESPEDSEIDIANSEIGSYMMVTNKETFDLSVTSDIVLSNVLESEVDRVEWFVPNEQKPSYKHFEIQSSSQLVDDAVKSDTEIKDNMKGFSKDTGYIKPPQTSETNICTVDEHNANKVVSPLLMESSLMSDIGAPRPEYVIPEYVAEQFHAAIPVETPPDQEGPPPDEVYCETTYTVVRRVKVKQRYETDKTERQLTTTIERLAQQKDNLPLIGGDGNRTTGTNKRSRSSSSSSESDSLYHTNKKLELDPEANDYKTEPPSRELNTQEINASANSIGRVEESQSGIRNSFSSSSSSSSDLDMETKMFDVQEGKGIFKYNFCELILSHFPYLVSFFLCCLFM